MLNLEGKSCDLNNQWTVEGGCIGERLCVHSGEGCVYICVCVHALWKGGGALQNGVHHGRMCVCTVGRDVHCALLWTSRWKEEGRKNVFGWLCGVCTVASCLTYDSFDRLCSVGTVASCLAYDSFDRLCSVGTVASCLAYGSFDRLCSVVWPMTLTVLMGWM